LRQASEDKEDYCTIKSDQMADKTALQRTAPNAGAEELSFQFFDLPRELRDMVYAALLQGRLGT